MIRYASTTIAMGMAMRTEETLARVDQNFDSALERLFELLRIPSISTDSAFDEACTQAGQWLVDRLSALGFEAQLCSTAGKPMVLAKHHHAMDAQTILFYGHYDVQPVDPLALWNTPPFEPSVIEIEPGRKIIAARGASDDKGQLMTFIEACTAILAVDGALPLNVTILLEGEEESGSPSLPDFLESYKDHLAADLALVCDTGMWKQSIPAITTRLRGMATLEVTLTGANQDLHSGMFGGIAANPIHVLTSILAELHDLTGRVTLPGFYDGVAPLAHALEENWRSLNFVEKDFLGEIGLEVPAGEVGYGGLHHMWSRPTCEINGIAGGYQGEGFKTVIPSRAVAKISCRLVGQQDPQKILASLKQFFLDRLPPDCSVNFDLERGAPALEVDTNSSAFKAAQRGLEAEWQADCALIGCGGSIPIVGEFKRELGIDTILVGFAHDDDRMHSPNEKYELTSFHRGIRSWVHIIDQLANQIQV